MKIELIKINNMSGALTSYYSVCYNDSDTTIFDDFLSENRLLNQILVNEIVLRLIDLANNIGANEFFFKYKNIKPGDNVCYLREPHLTGIRLFCIRYGEKLVVLGSGGPKFKGKKSTKSNNILLKKENERMSKISTLITSNNTDFKGNLILINE